MEDQPEGSPLLSIKERAKIQAQLGNIKQQIVKAITGKKQEKTVLELQDVGDEHFGAKGTLYFKNCEECEFIVNAPSVKVLIEGCKQCKITLNGHVKTEILEIWRCDDFVLTLNTVIRTLQADICSNIQMHFGKAEYLGQLVWAGLKNLVIDFEDSPENNMKTGLEEMAKEVADLNPETDQFIARFLEGKLKQELIVRLENGFPTTEREANDFDEKAKHNAELAEAYVRKLVEEAKITLKPTEQVAQEQREKEEKEKEHGKGDEGEGHKHPNGEKENEVAGGNAADAGGGKVSIQVPGHSPETGEGDRKQVKPERKPSKKPERVFIGVED